MIEKIVIDINGAIKFLKISTETLRRWEKNNALQSFKAVYNGRLRKCYYVSDLKALAGQGNEVSIERS